MAFKYYDVVSARSADELKRKLNEKIGEGWQPYGAMSVSSVSGTEDVYHQAIAAEGDVTTRVVVTPEEGGAVVSDPTREPEYYYVLVTAGQSNNMATGEGMPLPDSYDRPDPRIKQLARRSVVRPGGAACKYNDVIEADHCLHDVEDMSAKNHPNADLSRGQYGCVGHGLHIAKRLLPYIPVNAGILIVPCSRGGSAFTDRDEGTYNPETGATADSSRWGVGKPLYMDLIARTKAALEKNPKNVLLAVYWMQGEGDCMSSGYTGHPALFTAMVKQFRTDLAAYAGQCLGGDAARVPWVCGDTTFWWKQQYPTQYSLVYGAYRKNSEPNVHFVELMKDETGVNVPTNNPAEDPDVPEANYYGAASRTAGNWTNPTRAMHFSSWARRGILPDRIASAILTHAGRNGPFLAGGDITENYPEPAKPKSNVTTLYSGAESEGAYAAQGWTLSEGKAEVVQDESSASGRALKLSQGDTQNLKLTREVANAAELLKNGGKITCRFKVNGEAVNKKIAVAMYLKLSESDAQGIEFVGKTESTSPCLVGLFLQSDESNKLSLMKNGDTSEKIAGFGTLNNEWHTLELVYPGGGQNKFTPYVDTVKGPETTLTRFKVDGAENTLILTDASNTDTYETWIDTLTVEVNSPAA